MPADTEPPLVALRGVAKRHAGAAGACDALAGVDLDVARGEFVAVVGPSGSGKSTLLHVIGGIDRADRGEVVVGGAALHTLGEGALTAWRATNVGIVFQFFQLLPTLTALENVLLAMDFGRRWPAAERRGRATALLARLGVHDQADKFPATMSGGQQQRVAVARALANAPRLLLADEPTGNLDQASAHQLLDQLAGLVRDDGLTVVMVTHEQAAVRRAGRTVVLVDGRIGDRSAAPEPAHA